MRIRELCEDRVDGRTDVDFYVPVTVEYDENGVLGTPTCTFSLRGPDSSLVEIAVNAATGRIVRVILIAIHNLFDEGLFADALGRVEAVSGNPVFDLEEFHERDFLRIDCRLRFSLGGHQVSAVWRDDQINRAVRMGPVTFYEGGEGEVIGLRVEGFGKDEWDEITEGVEYAIETMCE